jgi:hypothetical protein
MTAFQQAVSIAGMELDAPRLRKINSPGDGVILIEMGASADAISPS